MHLRVIQHVHRHHALIIGGETQLIALHQVRNLSTTIRPLLNRCLIACHFFGFAPLCVVNNRPLPTPSRPIVPSQAALPSATKTPRPSQTLGHSWQAKNQAGLSWNYLVESLRMPAVFFLHIFATYSLLSLSFNLTTYLHCILHGLPSWLCRQRLLPFISRVICMVACLARWLTQTVIKVAAGIY